MVMTSVDFECFESSHSVGMSGEGHQMVCEIWMEIVRVLSFQSHKKVKCVYITQRKKLFVFAPLVKDIWKLPKTNQR